MNNLIERIEKGELAVYEMNAGGFPKEYNEQAEIDLIGLAKLGQQYKLTDLNYWKTKAEGEHLGFIAIQEDNNQLKKYAELGRLAIEAIDKSGFENCNGIFDDGCNRNCEWYYFCQKRAELLVEL